MREKGRDGTDPHPPRPARARRDTSDPPLTAEGRDQAGRAAALAASGSTRCIPAPCCGRCRPPQPFAALSGHEIETREGIVEFDRGTGAYMPMEELKRDDYAAWKAFVAGDDEVDIVAFQSNVVETLEEIVTRNPARRWRCSATAG